METPFKTVLTMQLNVTLVDRVIFWQYNSGLNSNKER